MSSGEIYNSMDALHLCDSFIHINTYIVNSVRSLQ